jgi:hypothetical protein
MKKRKIRWSQIVLGFCALLWAAYLLPHTSFVWWIRSNALYGVLAILAAILGRFPAYQRIGHGIVILGALIFGVGNGMVAKIGCTTGGTCGLIIVVMTVILSAQLAVLFLDYRSNV